MAADGEVTFNITGEAAYINHVADVIGEWADRMGFREEWADADWLDSLADELQRDDAAEFRVSTVDRPARLREIAQKHRKMANATKLMLMVSETVEALNDLRDGDPADGPAYGEELADIVIRALENAQRNRQPIGDIIIRKIDINQEREYKHGRQF
jgi:hypothetical protein